MESVSRTAGSSSTTKISPRETGFSAMFHRPCVVKPDAHSNNGTQVHTGSKRTRICTGRSLNAQVATHPLIVEQGVHLCGTRQVAAARLSPATGTTLTAAGSKKACDAALPRPGHGGSRPQAAQSPQLIISSVLDDAPGRFFPVLPRRK